METLRLRIHRVQGVAETAGPGSVRFSASVSGSTMSPRAVATEISSCLEQPPVATDEGLAGLRALGAALVAHQDDVAPLEGGLLDESIYS